MARTVLVPYIAPPAPFTGPDLKGVDTFPVPFGSASASRAYTLAQTGAPLIAVIAYADPSEALTALTTPPSVAGVPMSLLDAQVTGSPSTLKTFVYALEGVPASGTLLVTKNAASHAAAVVFGTITGLTGALQVESVTATQSGSSAGPASVSSTGSAGGLCLAIAATAFDMDLTAITPQIAKAEERDDSTTSGGGLYDVRVNVAVQPAGPAVLSAFQLAGVTRWRCVALCLRTASAPAGDFGPYEELGALFDVEDIYRFAPSNSTINPLDEAIPLSPAATTFGWSATSAGVPAPGTVPIVVDPVRGPVLSIPYPAGMAGGGGPKRFQGPTGFHTLGAVVTGASATRAGQLVTMNTTTPHGLAVNDTAYIGPSYLGGYGGFCQVASTPTATRFTYLIASYETPTSPLAGAFTVQKVTLPTKIGVGYLVKLSANWSDNGNVATKFLWPKSPYGDAQRDRTSLAGVAGQNHFTSVTWGNPTGDVLTLTSNLQGGGSGGGANYVATVSYPRDRWVKVQMYWESNTGSSPNGKIRMWATDTVTGIKTLVVTRDNVPFHEAGQAHGWHNIWFDPTYGGGVNPVPADQDIRLDDFFVVRNRPAAAPGASLAPAYTLPAGVTWNPITRSFDGVTVNAPYNLAGQTGTVRVCADSAAFSAALSAAVRGDVIVLNAGTTYTGNFVLPTKGGTGWIYIVSSRIQAGTFPKNPGQRVSPADVAAMPKVRCTNDTAIITAASNSSHWRLVGLNITCESPAGGTNYGLVYLGDGSQTNISQFPNFIGLDRCYVHGNTTMFDCYRGVALWGANQFVVDSYVSEIYTTSHDSQGISMGVGPGPYFIDNTHAEAASECIMSGGIEPNIVGVEVADLYIRNSYLYKNPTWFTNSPGNFYNKNNLELKHARRVLVHGCVLENAWADPDQQGQSVLVTPVVQESGAAFSYLTVQDVTFYGNVIKATSRGVRIVSFNNAGSAIPVAATRIGWYHNAFIQIGSYNENGRQVEIGFYSSGANHLGVIDFQHNTFVNKPGGSTNAAMTFFTRQTKGDGLTFKDNLMQGGQYGIFDADMGSGQGKAVLDFFLTTYVFAGNCFTVPTAGSGAAYPTGNSYPASMAAVGFVNVSALATLSDIALAGSSPYKGTATDGSDPGADITYLAAVTNNVTVGY